MDIATMSMALNMSMVQSNASTMILGKTMDLNAQLASTLISDMEAAIPAPAMLAPKLGNMDIRI